MCNNVVINNYYSTLCFHIPCYTIYKLECREHCRFSQLLLQPLCFRSFKAFQISGRSFQCGDQPVPVSTHPHWPGEGISIFTVVSRLTSDLASLICSSVDLLQEWRWCGWKSADRSTSTAKQVPFQIVDVGTGTFTVVHLSLIHISEPTRPY